jgi:hypothetical protein
VGHTSRFGGLLRLEASHARISQSGLKTGGGVTMGGARGIEWKLKMDGLMRWAASDTSTPTLSFSLY